MNKVETITTFEEYIKCINIISDSLINSFDKEEIMLFRGHSNKEYKLLPSIA